MKSAFLATGYMDRGLLKVQSGLRYEVDSGLSHDIHKPVPPNKAGNLVPGKEIVPSSLFQGNPLSK